MAEVSARSASFENASLVDCSMMDADLTGASFARSYLLAAGLDGSDLRGATFVEADFDATSFGHALIDEELLPSAFVGAVENLLLREIRLVSSRGERTAGVVDLISTVNAHGADLVLADRLAIARPVVPWRWRTS